MKEKEAARKEYKQAVERGHGAYLMDQDAPVRPPSERQLLRHRVFYFCSLLCFSPQDVFTISVGNLPPAATVLIKVTFVSELVVKDGSVLFSLPGSVAPWLESAALNQTTQVRDGRSPVQQTFSGSVVACRCPGCCRKVSRVPPSAGR